jgi:hypothetical protein
MMPNIYPTREFKKLQIFSRTRGKNDDTLDIIWETIFVEYNRVANQGRTTLWITIFLTHSHSPNRRPPASFSGADSESGSSQNWSTTLSAQVGLPLTSPDSFLFHRTFLISASGSRCFF